MAYYSVNVSRKNIFAIIGIVAVIIGFLVTIFTRGQLITDHYYDKDDIDYINNFVWGSSSLNILQVGSLLALIFGTLVPILIFKEPGNQWLVAFAAIVIIGGIMMFRYEELLKAGATGSYDSYVAPGCIVSGILYIIGGLSEAIACFSNN